MAHKTVFSAGVSDEEWLTTVGKHGWIVLTKDGEIRRNPRERDALLDAGVKAFVLTSGHLGGPDMIDIFLKQLAKMERLIHKERGGFIASVNKSGVELLAHHGRGQRAAAGR